MVPTHGPARRRTLLAMELNASGQLSKTNTIVWQA